MSISTPDPLGLAISDYHSGLNNSPLIVHSKDFEDDEIDISYFFRSYSEMPILEQKALELCNGSILDIGSCAGTHSIWLQKNQKKVTAIEQSKLCCNILSQRGIKNVINGNYFEHSQKYDTLLLLMNGIGIAGKMNQLSNFFIHLKKNLNSGGQVLLDSSDLIYLYEQEDGSVDLNLGADTYYGELDYQFEYKGIKGEWFPWLYLDIDNMINVAEFSGFKVADIIKGDHYDYLIQLKL